MQKVPRTDFSTSEMPASKRYEAFRESMSVIFEVSEIQKQKEDFNALIETHHLGETLMVDCKTNSQLFERTPRMIARDGIDHYLVQIFKYGYTRRLAGDEAIGSKENILILDASRPWKAMTSNFHNLSFIIPRSALSQLLKNENDHHARTIDSRNPFFKILLSYLLNLREQAPTMNLDDSIEASQVGIQLLASTLNKETACRGSRSVKTDHSDQLKWSIRKFLKENLHDPELNVEQLVSKYRISRSHIYRLFREDQGVAECLRKIRMESALKRLRSPSFKNQSVSEISHSVGYRNLNSFCRSFKKTFDLTPQDVRNSISSFEIPRQRPSHRIWEQWFLEL